MEHCILAIWIIKTSPLKSVNQTASVLSDFTNVSVINDDDLVEWQNGLIAGMPCDEARKKYPRPEINILYGQ